MKLPSSLTLRKMGGKYVVYRIDPVTKERSMIVLNDTAAFLWQKFSSSATFTVQDLASALVDEYEIDFETAFQDASVLAKGWLEGGFACE